VADADPAARIRGADFAGNGRHTAQMADVDGRRAQERAYLSHPDLLLAATALQQGLTVVTRDRSDFDKAQVPVLNPWEQ
jgi:predicted nucleic acid-binding protein